MKNLLKAIVTGYRIQRAQAKITAHKKAIASLKKYVDTHNKELQKIAGITIAK